MIPLKSPADIKIMKAGGRRLAKVMQKMLAAVKPETTLLAIEQIADAEIKRLGGAPSFKKVPGYRWATCLNINEGVVHGIPSNYRLAAADVLSLDVGMLYRGFHTDMSTSVAVSGAGGKFLAVGKTALKKAVEAAKAGNYVAQISLAMEKEIRQAGFSPVEALTGHGVGKKLHEEPAIPCFWQAEVADSPRLQVGMVLAIEVIYAQGLPEVVLDQDNWTIETADGKPAGLFEQTVAVTAKGPVILTA